MTSTFTLLFKSLRYIAALVGDAADVTMSSADHVNNIPELLFLPKARTVAGEVEWVGRQYNQFILGGGVLPVEDRALCSLKSKGKKRIQ
jgi:hypothetical protein